jgi:hypothetical protein
VLCLVKSSFMLWQLMLRATMDTLDTPIPRPVMPPGDGDIVAIPRSGALIIGTNGAPPERSSRLIAHEPH